MGKLKKKIRKKVNPERSNKMIIAVVAGLILILVVAFVAVVDFGPPADKSEMMTDTMAYLEKGDGIIEVKLLPEQNKVIIVYDGNNTDKIDFKKVAGYAGLRLSNKIKDVEFTVALVNNKDKEAKEEYSVISKGGRNIRAQ
jgi:hypothetical protein